MEDYHLLVVNCGANSNIDHFDVILCDFFFSPVCRRCFSENKVGVDNKRRGRK